MPIYRLEYSRGAWKTQYLAHEAFPSLLKKLWGNIGALDSGTELALFMAGCREAIILAMYTLMSEIREAIIIGLQKRKWA
jgi:hypothetical protein